MGEITLATLNLVVYEEVEVSDYWVIVVTGDGLSFVVSLEDYREALGPLALTLTGEEIQRVYLLSDRLAGVLFDMWRLAGKSKVK